MSVGLRQLSGEKRKRDVYNVDNGDALEDEVRAETSAQAEHAGRAKDDLSGLRWLESHSRCKKSGRGGTTAFARYIYICTVRVVRLTQ